MALMVNGKKVVGYALGGNEFYSIDENADGSITYKGYTYEWKATKKSDSFQCEYNWDTATTPYSVSVDSSQRLSSDSILTVKDLINKGKIIKLIVTSDDTSNNTSSSLNSGIIDLSKPDSKGHFNFQWANNDTSKNAYCSSDPSANVFSIYSNAINSMTPENDYVSFYMQILY